MLRSLVNWFPSCNLSFYKKSKNTKTAMPYVPIKTGDHFSLDYFSQLKHFKIIEPVNRPPPLFPEPNYSFIVVIAFAFLTIFSKKRISK